MNPAMTLACGMPPAAHDTLAVMAGLGPAIHVLPSLSEAAADPCGALPFHNAIKRIKSWMAGTSPAMTMERGMGGYVYLMTNRPNGTLYCGVTNDIARRTHEHREGLVPGFTKRHGLKRLVWFAFHEDIRDAIQRESTMKHWPRAWKTRLIMAENPDWNDLYDTLA